MRRERLLKYASSICTLPARIGHSSGKWSRKRRNHRYTASSPTWQSLTVCRTGTPCVKHHRSAHSVRGLSFVPASHVSERSVNGLRQRRQRYRRSDAAILRDRHRGQWMFLPKTICLICLRIFVSDGIWLSSAIMGTRIKDELRSVYLVPSGRDYPLPRYEKTTGCVPDGFLPSFTFTLRALEELMSVFFRRASHQELRQ